MKKSYLLILLSFLLMPFYAINGQLFLENFDYPVGDSLINHGWINHSGSGNQLVVTAGNLTYTGYPASGIGNSVIIAGGSGSREDVHADFAPQGENGAIYAAFLANISTATTTGDYFFHLAPAFSTTFFKPRLLIRDDGSGNLQFGLTKALTGSAVYTTTPYAYNTTYLLVVKYEFFPGDSNDVAYLFINPPVGAEPSMADLTSADIVPDDSIATVCLRQGGQAYTVQVDGITIGTSWLTTVPVELTSFTAEIINGNVMLNWSTATETNNSGFEVQRKEGINEFEVIGFVPGYGTTTENKAYNFVDDNLTSGYYTYRLKQIDFDGSFSFSDEVNVEVTNPNQFELSQNYPNPFNPSTIIKYSIPEPGDVKLAVYNLVGEEVAVLVNGFTQAGTFEVIFDASKLSSGLYLYKLQSANSVMTKKMMLLK